MTLASKLNSLCCFLSKPLVPLLILSTNNAFGDTPTSPVRNTESKESLFAKVEEEKTGVDEKSKNTIRIDNTFSYIKDLPKNWNLTYGEFIHDFEFGSLGAFINQAYRFGKNATQYGFVSYPELTDWSYMYLSYAHSDNSLFPKNRYDSEIYFSLPFAFEFSAGYNHFQYRDGKSRLYTGTFGKYYGNYWLSYRPYFSHANSHISVSHSLTLRRYIETADHFISLFVITGKAPADLNDATRNSTSKSSAIRFSGEKPLFKGVTLNWGVGYTHEKYTFSKRRTWDFTTGFSYKF